MTALSLAWSIWATATEPQVAYFVTPARAWEFGVGGLLALVAPAARSHVAVSWAGLLLIAAAAFAYSPATPFPGSPRLRPRSSNCCCIWAAAPTPPLTWRPVQALGDTSYSVYLWHWPLIVFAPIVLDRAITMADKLAILALTLALGWLSKVLVEDPARHWRTLTQRRAVLTLGVAGAATAVVLAVAAAGTLEVREDVGDARAETRRALAQRPACFGAAARDPALTCDRRRLAQMVVPSPIEARDSSNQRCTRVERRGTLNVCAFGARKAQSVTMIALIGDSHASHWRAALDTVAEDRHWQARSLAHTDCPLSDAVPDLPPAQRAECLRCGTVRCGSGFVSGPRRRSPSSRSPSNAGVVAPGRDSFTTQVRGYRNAWAWLPQSVERVVVLRDTPRALPRGGTLECVDRAMRDGRAAGVACALPRARALLPDPAAVAARGAPRVSVVDLTRFFCDARRCVAVVGGALVHRDVSHMTTVFAVYARPVSAARARDDRAPMIELAAGTVFAGYRLDGLAGRGGMGVVYRATDPALERTVAIKVMAPWLIEDEAAHRRFVRESRLAASIQHPNVIPIHAAGEHEGRAYIVMRFVEGSDLRALIRREGGLPPERAARIVAQVAAGLDAAHRAGLVHRDVKPANVLLDGDDHAYLTDFGLTRGDWSTSGPQPTESGVFVGTSDYVAPEQIRGGAVDARADIYSLGAVLYHALTGEAPFAGRNHEAILWAHLHRAAAGPRRRVAPGSTLVIARAMAKRPADRYPSAGDLGRAAVAAALGSGCARVRARSASVRPRRTTGPRRWPSPRRTGGGGGGSRRPSRCSAAAAAFALTDRDSETPRAPPAPDATATPTPTPSGPQVRTIPMRGRPVSLAAAGDRIWALAGTQTRLVSICAGHGQARTVADLPRGGEELEVSGDDMYAAFDRPPQVLRLDSRTGERLAASDVFAGPTRRVDVGLGKVWVTERSTDETQPDHLLRLDPETLETEMRMPMLHGARDVRSRAGSIPQRPASAAARRSAASGRAAARPRSPARRP